MGGVLVDLDLEACKTAFKTVLGFEDIESEELGNCGLRKQEI